VQGIQGRSRNRTAKPLKGKDKREHPSKGNIPTLTAGVKICITGGAGKKLLTNGAQTGRKEKGKKRRMRGRGRGVP